MDEPRNADQSDALPGPDLLAEAQAELPASLPSPQEVKERGGPMSADVLLQRELDAQREQRAARPPRRRGWLLLLATALAIGTGATYWWQYTHTPDKMELLKFVSLWLTFPLSLSVILLFAYFRYPSD